MSLPTAPAPTDRALPDTPWQRLSPRMLFIHPVRALAQMIAPLLGVVVAGVATGGADLWWLIFLAVAPIVLGVAQWALTTYRLTGDQIQLKTGVVQRNVLSAHVDRVRTVDVTATVLHRLLGIATVHVGTGAAKPFVLDGLPKAAADSLRQSLLVAGRATDGDAGAARSSHVAPGAPDALGAGTPRPGEHELARFDAAWLRFAPFTLSGLLLVVALWGFVGQIADDVDWHVVEGATSGLSGFVADRSWWLVGALATVSILVVLTALSIVMYAVQYGGYRLVRQPGGTLHSSRGLLTTRSTTVEEQRIRGACLDEPVLLRPVRGASATLLTARVHSANAEALGLTGGSSDFLTPPAPLDLVGGVVESVLGVAGVARGPLTRHGGAATRRRWTRAVVPAVLLAATATAVGAWFDAPTWMRVVPWLLVAATVPVAIGRARALGHAVVADHLVARSGVFPRARKVLGLPGVIGWVWTTSPLQRRVGLVNLWAMTSADDGKVVVLDVPEGAALGVAAEAHLDILRPFLERRGD